MTVPSKKVKGLLKIGLTLGVLVVLMLATVGAWEIYKGTVRLVGTAQADGQGQALLCFTAKPDFLKLPKPPGKVVVMHEFSPDGQSLFVGLPHTLCVQAGLLK